MLASIGDYLQAWEAYEILPTIAIFVSVWLVGGGYLFQKILGVQTDRRKYSLSRGVLVSLLSGFGGAFAAFALYYIAKTIVPTKPDPDSIPINWFGAALGIIGYFAVCYLVVLSMHKLSAGKTLKSSFVPLVVPAIVGALVVGSSFYFLSYGRVKENRKHQKLVFLTSNQMYKIYKSLERKKIETGLFPSSLEDLVKEKYLTPEDLKSPVNPKGRGFFYNGGETITDVGSREVLLCDYKENFGKKGRTVLYRGGYPEFLSEASFQARLRQPENQEFAKALEAAEKK